MPVSAGSIIYGADYNSVRVKAVQVLGSGSPFGPGTGSPNYGYNQALVSTAVSPTTLITHTQFQNLANDVNKAYKHITNTNFTGYLADPGYAAVGSTITALDLNRIETAVNYAITNRLTAHPSQLTAVIQNGGVPYYRTTAWGAGATAINQQGNFAFGSANAMQYFFNQGGKIVFQGTYRGTPVSTQDTTWQTLSNAFTFTIDASNFTSFDGISAYYSQYGPTAYSLNRLWMVLGSNSPVTGSIAYSIEYRDNHVPTGAGPDSVTGTGSTGVGFSITVSRSSGEVVGTAPTHNVTLNTFT